MRCIWTWVLAEMRLPRYLWNWRQLAMGWVHVTLGLGLKPRAGRTGELGEAGVDSPRMRPPLSLAGRCEAYVPPGHHRLACGVGCNTSSPVGLLPRLGA